MQGHHRELRGRYGWQESRIAGSLGMTTDCNSHHKNRSRIRRKTQRIVGGLQFLSKASQ